MKKKRFGISIRIQLFVGFLIPIVFIVLVGSISYRQARESLTSNYTTSSLNTLRMTVTSLDDSLKNVQNNLAELSQDANVKSYALGGYVNNASSQSTIRNSIDSNIMVKQTATKMIYGIHIITIDEEQFLTTQTLDAAGDESFLTEMKESEDAYLLSENGIYWGSSHPFLNTKLKTEESDYPLFCSRTIKSGDLSAIVVIDVSSKAIQGLLDELDFGTESQVSFISGGGKEIRNGEVTEIALCDFFLDNKSQIGEDGFADYVTYEGKSYYFMMDACSVADGYVCAMVPKSIITAGSDGIRTITVMLVLIACGAALLVSTLLIRKIGRNISGSVKRLDKVSQGELTHEQDDWKREGNEFGKLQDAIYETVDRMRSLVETVKDMIREVSGTGERVTESSMDVGLAVEDMNQKIDRIHTTIQNEDKEIESCNRLMEELSSDIKRVSRNILEIMDEIEKSEAIINSGMEAVKSMNSQSKDTSDATDAVASQINLLGNKMEEISHFVEIIESIAEETNLLSLNASIEAARAGENGRGFSVVAEEIRKLADNSSVTAKTIQEVISEVKEFSEKAVAKAKTAEGIVALQVESAANTEHAFCHISSFMSQLTERMDCLTAEIEEMNKNRHEAVKAVKRIGELSDDTITSANSVNDSLEKQISCTEELETEAGKLKENMEKLQEAVASFKIS